MAGSSPHLHDQMSTKSVQDAALKRHMRYSIGSRVLSREGSWMHKGTKHDTLRPALGLEGCNQKRTLLSRQAQKAILEFRFKGLSTKGFKGRGAVLKSCALSATAQSENLRMAPVDAMLCRCTRVTRHPGTLSMTAVYAFAWTVNILGERRHTKRGCLHENSIRQSQILGIPLTCRV